MKISRIAAVETDIKNESHSLDHLAPLCHYLGIPFYLSEDKSLRELQAMYPKVDFVVYPFRETPIQNFVKQFDVLIHTQFLRPLWEKELIRAELLEDCQRMRFVYLPHGNSDKGYESFWMEHYLFEDLCFVYGKKMEGFLQEKEIYPLMLKPMRIGNLRYQYYLKFYDHYNSWAANILPKGEKVLLYAPSWNWHWDEKERKSCLLKVVKNIEKIPKDWTIWVKLHPRIFEDNLYEMYQVEALLKKYPSAHLLPNTPLVYPILDRVDAILGDNSSVMYDFLSFNKPIFLYLEQKEKRPLHQAARLVGSDFFENINKYYEKDLQGLSSEREALYQDTFDVSVRVKNIPQSLIKSLNTTEKKTLEQCVKELSILQRQGALC